MKVSSQFAAFRSRLALAVVASLALASLTVAATFGSNWPSISAMIAKVPTQKRTVVAANGDTQRIKIVNFGQVVYTGPVDVKSTLDRIRANSALPHDNDGTIWTNAQRALPTAPSGYYREFVVWPASTTTAKPYGITFPGPMRLVIGKNGETYFTGDHYSTFQNVK